MAKRVFMDDFRRFFLRGLGALVPTLLTFAILVWAFRLINDYVGTPITAILLGVCSSVRDEPAPWMIPPDRLERDALRYGQPINEWNEKGQRLTLEYKIVSAHKLLLEKDLKIDDRLVRDAKAARDRALWQIAFAKYRLHLLGFLIAIVLVYFTGFFLASFIGRTSWRATEGLLYKIPLIRAVYPNIKQVTDFLLTERKVEFSGVVAAQYPRLGVWSVGLLTGGPMKQVQSTVKGDLVTVFIPSSPTPVTGYVIQLPSADVINLNMTIDEALRFTISGGVIKPGAIEGMESEVSPRLGSGSGSPRI